MKTILLTIFLLSLLSGCQHPVNMTNSMPEHSVNNTVEIEKFITDSSLEKDVTVVRVHQTTVSSNLLKVEALLSNSSSRKTEILYKFEWLDNRSISIASPLDAWKRLTLHGGEQKTISAVAISPNATDFLLKLKEQ